MNSIKTPQKRVFYTFDETRARLGLDMEGFRQALIYDLQSPEKGTWLPAFVDSAGSDFTGPIKGNLAAHPDHSAPAIRQDGTVVPDSGSDAHGWWDKCGGQGSGYGALYIFGGRLVVDPSAVIRAAEQAGDDGHWWLDCVRMTPYSWIDGGSYPDAGFMPVISSNSLLRAPPKDATSLFFLASDVERLANSAQATAPEKPLDNRERTTLLNIIGALAKAANLDLGKHQKAGETVAAMLSAEGVEVSARTIGDHLKAVREAMASRTK